MSLKKLSHLVVVISATTIPGLGAGDVRPVPNPGPSPSLEALSILGIDSTDVTCHQMSKEALLAEPPPPPPSSTQNLESAAQRVDNVMVCPTGFVPRYADADADNDDSSFSSLSSCSTDKYYWAGAVQGKTSTTGYGVHATLSIHNPSLRVACDQSTGQISVVKGSNTSVVETGVRKWWHSYPKLIISHWRNGGYFDDDGFVYTHPTYSNHMNLSSYVGTNRQFSIRYNSAQGNWWIWFNNGWVGYFPGSLWNGTFTRADVHHWYGEVLSADDVEPPRTHMGSGYRPPSSLAAIMHSMWTLDVNGVWGVHSTNYGTIITDWDYYDIQFTSTNSIRYGGNGLIPPDP